jgi:hypothetical protein
VETYMGDMIFFKKNTYMLVILGRSEIA